MRWLKGQQKINLIITWLAFNTFTKVNTEKICQSTEIINNDFKKLQNLKECEVIEGSLTMAKISSYNITKYSFPVREITGYLLIYRLENIKSLGQLFPNLTLIRGEEVFDQYSLTVYENIHLVDLGLKNFIKILKGSVRIENNPALCYVQTVNWIEILTEMSQQQYILKRNQNFDHCPICEELTNSKEVFNENYCWTYNDFQKVCRQTCHQSNCKENCCNSTCLSSCTLNKGDSWTCSVCKDYKDPSGMCVKNCGPYLFEFNKRRCVIEAECRYNNMIPFEGKCIKTCPENFIENVAEKTCINCLTSKCYKPCNGSVVIKDESDAKMFKECTKVNGYLAIELKKTNQKIISVLENYLADIEEITGYLRISKSPQITTLHFLKSLTTVRGDTLYNDKYSFYVNENFNLENLWFDNQKIAFLNGSSFFHLNPRFCLQHALNLTFKTEKQKEEIIPLYQSSNGQKTFCEKTNINATVEAINATAARIKLDPLELIELRQIFLGYLYYYIVAPEKNISVYDGLHGCGHDNWQMDLTHVLNIRHIFNNLEPNTQYAYFVRTFSITDYHIKLNGISEINYFTTLSIDGRPNPITKFFYNVINGTAIEIFWWPPLKFDEVNHIYKILVDIKHPTPPKLTEEKDEEQEVDDERQEHIDLSSCSKKSTKKWRGITPNDIDYYNREQFLVEDIMPDYLFVSNRVEKPDDNSVPEEFPKQEAVFDQSRLRSFLDYIKAVEKQFIDDQDTGIEDFPIVEAEVDESKNIKCSKCFDLNGNRTNFMIRSLIPKTVYKISIRICNKLPNYSCSVETFVEARTMDYIDDTTI